MLSDEQIAQLKRVDEEAKKLAEAEAGRKSIAYSAWKESVLFKVAKLLDAAKIPYGMIIGDLSAAERKRFKDQFNEGKTVRVQPYVDKKAIATSLGGVPVEWLEWDVALGCNVYRRLI